jgi:hypothetical protein
MPQTFFDNEQYIKVLRDGLSAVVYKEVPVDVLQKEGYVSTHAITLVLKGELRIENINKGVAHVRANQLIFTPKGLYNVSDIIHDGEDSFKAIVFFFDEQLVDEFIKSLNLKVKSPVCTPHLTMAYSEPIRLYTETLLKLYGNKTHQHHTVTRAKLFELLHLISIGERGEAFVNSLLSLKNKEKRNLKDFMAANFDKSLSVEDYAYLTGRSLSTLNVNSKCRQRSGSWTSDSRKRSCY